MHSKPEIRSAKSMNGHHAHKHSHRIQPPLSSVGRLHFGMPRSGGKELHSQANASWGELPVSQQDYESNKEEGFSSRTTTNLPQHYQSQPILSPSLQRNRLVDNDSIQDLLAMLKSNDFAGEMDPQHHSQYFVSPELAIHGKYGLVQTSTTINTSQTESPKPTTHRSDGHLLQVNNKRR